MLKVVVAQDFTRKALIFVTHSALWLIGVFGALVNNTSSILLLMHGRGVYSCGRPLVPSAL